MSLACNYRYAASRRPTGYPYITRDIAFGAILSGYDSYAFYRASVQPDAYCTVGSGGGTARSRAVERGKRDGSSALPSPGCHFVDHLVPCRVHGLRCVARRDLGIDSKSIRYSNHRAGYARSVIADIRRVERLGSILAELISRLLASTRVLRKYTANPLRLQLYASVRHDHGADIV
jgi:hypothetical protein